MNNCFFDSRNSNCEPNLLLIKLSSLNVGYTMSFSSLSNAYCTRDFLKDGLEPASFATSRFFNYIHFTNCVGH